MTSSGSVELSKPLQLRRGRAMPNRFMLAPLTNNQSELDGSLGDDEYHWLVRRAEGGFGGVMTCAAYVQRVGRAFPHQLGIDHDGHLDGLRRLAEGIRAHGSLALVQLHHGGERCPTTTVDQPVAPSDGTAGEPPFDRAARALTTEEVEQLRDDFVAAARRAERAGFDGVELHGAHGYIISAFLSPTMNQRTDRYGGSLANRARLLHEIIDGIREVCGDEFIVGVRLSPERFGQRLDEIISVASDLLIDPRLDFVDMSLWDCFAEPKDDAFAGTTLAGHFADLPRDGVALGFAGKLYRTEDLDRLMATTPPDFVLLGRAAIVRHDIPRAAAAGETFEMRLPVTVDHLRSESVSDRFIDYLRNWPDFVAD